ncbi:replication initiation protein Rep [Streptococcus infantarius subsp. infantarius]|nr:replication initiation protein Rep [Streptococcus infantarius subsp. infantarius]
MNLNRDITIHQLETQKFYPIPQIFSRSIERKWDDDNNRLVEIHHVSPYNKLSSDAKLAYGIFLNRIQLSIYSYKQGNKDYVDEAGAVFMIYTVNDLMKVLDKSKNTVIKIKRELTDLGLLREVRLGKNRPNRLYLQNVDATNQITELYDENDQLLKRVDYFGNILYENKNVKSLDNKGGSKNELPGGSKNELREVQKMNPSNNNISNTDINNIISSRKTEKNSNEFSQSAETYQSLSKDQSVPFVEPKYYSLLQVIADKYNDQMFGFPDVLTMTHNQKMKIGQYLSESYVTSSEVLNMIDRIPKDSTSPLAYLLKSLENLKQERLYEQKSIAHLNAENYYNMKKQGEENV